MMILERVPASLRGELSRWLIEPRTGVFVGNPTSRVRDELWKLAITRSKDGSVLQIWSYALPQGYRYRAYGTSIRNLRDFEGIALVQVPPKGKPKSRPPTGDRSGDAPSLLDNPET